MTKDCFPLKDAQRYRVTVAEGQRLKHYVCKAYGDKAARRIIVNFGLCKDSHILAVNLSSK